MKQCDREGTPEELWAFKNWIMGASDREAIKERWKREEEERAERNRQARLEEYQRERARLERRNLIRDLFGL